MFQEWQNHIQKVTGISAGLQNKLIASILIVAALWLLRLLVVRIVWKRTDDVSTRYLCRKTATYVSFFLALLLVGLVWSPAIGSITTFLGLLSAGLAIALRDPVANFAGWVYILAKRPFTLGDRIQAGEHAGDVIDISVFQFTLMEIGNWVDAEQSTGRVVHLPNSVVFTQALANYSKGFKYIWNEIPVLITFESNWLKAKAILQEIATTHAIHLEKEAAQKVKEASRRFMIFYSSLAPKVYTSAKASGVLLTVRYLCTPHERRGTTEAIWEDILREFAKCGDIDFAYPTQRFYNRVAEGKRANAKEELHDTKTETKDSTESRSRGRAHG